MRSKGTFLGLGRSIVIVLFVALAFLLPTIVSAVSSSDLFAPSLYFNLPSEDYQLINRSRGAIEFGKPVEWNLEFTDGQDYYSVLYETDPIFLTVEDVLEDNTWKQTITAKTDFTEGYVDVPIVTSLPGLTNVTLSPATPFTYDSLMSQELFFSLEDLNGTETYMASGSSFESKSSFSFSSALGPLHVESSQGSLTSFSVKEDTVFIGVDGVRADKDLFVILDSPLPLSDKTHVMVTIPATGQQLPLPFVVEGLKLRIDASSVQALGSPVASFEFFISLEPSAKVAALATEKNTYSLGEEVKYSFFPADVESFVYLVPPTGTPFLLKEKTFVPETIGLYEIEASFYTESTVLFAKTNFSVVNNSRKNISVAPKQELSKITSHGLFSFSVSDGFISNFTLSDDLELSFQVDNLSLNQSINASLDLPFAIPEGIDFMLWKENEKTVAVPLTLTNNRSTIVLYLQDGVIDDDGVMDGTIIDPLQLFVPAIDPFIVGINSSTIYALVLQGNSSYSVKLETSAGVFSSFSFVEPKNTLHRPNVAFDYDLFSYEITLPQNKTSATVRITYPKAIPQNSLYYKFRSNDSVWSPFPFEKINASTISINLVDGGFGDEDGMLNGVIVDPSGIGWVDSLAAWFNRKEINISNVGSTTLTNFPAYLNISYSSGMQSDYDDIRFVDGSCDGNGSLFLAYELDNYTASSALMWINIPSLPPSGTTFCMYYNNSGALSGENISGVWDSSYVTVQHLEERSGIHVDSAGKNNGTNVGSIQDADGLLGGANDFTTATAIVDLGNDSSAQPTNAISVGAWVKSHDATTQWEAIGGYATNTAWNDGYGLFFDSGSTVQFYVNQYNANFAEASITPSNWNYVVGTYDSAAGDGEELKVYVNGVLGATTDNYGGAIVYGGGSSTIAEMGGWTTDWLNGQIDEFRISSVARSSDWINQSYQMMSNQSSVVTFGAEEITDAAKFNLSVISPAEFDSVDRNNLFTSNASVSCIQGNCGTVSVDFQYYATATPTVIETESTSADFSIFNASTNVSVVADKLTLDQKASTVFWWDVAWPYRQAFNISYSGSNVTEYTTELKITNLTVGSQFVWSDNSSLRFIVYDLNDGSFEEANYYVQNWSVTNQNATLQVKLPRLFNNSQLVMYYGNGAASSESNYSTVYLQAEEFSGSSIPAEFSTIDADAATGTDFTVANGQLNITASGADTSDPADEFGAVYYSDIAGDIEVITEVDYEQNINTLTKAGIMLRNDLSSAGTSKGYAFVASRPVNGYVFDRDENNNGLLESSSTAGVSAFPGYLRLTKSGSSVAGYYSTTGTGSWTQIGTAWSSTSAGTTQDVGLALTSRSSAILAEARFNYIIVKRYVATPPNITVNQEEAVNFSTAGQYISDTFDTGSPDVSYVNISWDETVPTSTSAVVTTRTSSDNVSWSPWFVETNGDAIQASPAQYIQYRTILTSSNETVTPRVGNISVGFKVEILDWTNVSASDDTFAGISPYSCGVMNVSSPACVPSLSVQPKQVGSYAMRIIANGDTTVVNSTISAQNNFTVYVQPQFVSFISNSSKVATNETVLLTAQLVDEFSSGLNGQNITFYDETGNGSRILVGVVETDNSGYASINYTIPTDATLTTHVFNVSFATDDVQYIRSTELTLDQLVSSRPQINAVSQSANEIGFGYNVTLQVNSTDIVGIDTVYINITGDEGNSVYALISGSGDVYSYTFNESWNTELFTYEFIVTNTDGLVSHSSLNSFEVISNFEFSFATEFDEYSSNDVVLINRSTNSTIYSEWGVRVPIIVTANKELTGQQVLLELDYTNFDFDRVQTDGSDLRVTYYNETTNTEQYLAHWMEYINTSAKRGSVWIKLPWINSTNQTVYLYYNNSAATDASNGTGVFEFFDDFENFSGWQKQGSGLVSQSSVRVTSGTYSGYKTTANDPNGAYKYFDSPLGRDIVIETRLNRNSVGAGGSRDRFGVFETGTGGYGFAYTSSSGAIAVETRTSSMGGSDFASSTSSITPNTWVDATLTILEDGTVQADRTIQRVPDGTVSASQTTYTTFDRYYIAGGYATWYDDIRIRKYTDATITTTFGEREPPGDFLKNKETTPAKGYLRMNAQVWSGSEWQNLVPPVIDQVLVDLADLGKEDVVTRWSVANGWNTSIKSPGTYRIYAVLEDANRNILENTAGDVIEFGYNFTIIEPTLVRTILTHEDLSNLAINEYETGGTIDFINVTIKAVNNTAFDANVTLAILDETLSPVNFGPNNEVQTCGDLLAEETCESTWTNSSNGYVIPLTATTNSAGFYWNITMMSLTGTTTTDTSGYFTIHHVPANISASLTKTRISKPNSTSYVLNITNPWSGNLTAVSATINCPAIANFSCASPVSGTNTVNLGTIENKSLTQTNFTITANASVSSGNYLANVTLNYTNPVGDMRSWSELATVVLEVRGVGVLELTDALHPLKVNRSTEYAFESFANNTGDTNASNASISYSLPTSWTITQGAAEQNTSTLEPNQTIENNITVHIEQAATLGAQEVRIDSGANDGRIDFITYDVEVYAPTTIVADKNSSFVDGGTAITITATLRYDNGSTLADQEINFTDVTANSSIGSAFTDGSGLATILYVIPSNASLGSHTILTSFAGNDSVFTLSISNTTTIDVHQTPSIASLLVSPNTISYGQTVSISGSISDTDTVDTVLMQITTPGGVATNYTPSFTPPFDYTYDFTETWDLGLYEITIFANDTLGSSSESTLNFTVAANITLIVTNENSSYGANKHVNLRALDSVWFDQSWDYRKTINISTTGTNLTYYQTYISVNFSDIYAQGKVQQYCEDIRFTYEDSEVPYFISNCNASDSSENETFWVRLENITAGATTELNMYYGNLLATSGSDEEATFSYETPQPIAYVVSDTGVSSGITITAMFNNTNISVGGSTYVRDEFGQVVISSGLVQGSSINSTKPVTVEVANVDTEDMVPPVSWAGTEFVYGGMRGTDRFCMLSPYGTANVTIKDGGTTEWSNTVSTSGTCVTNDIVSGNAARINADLPILVYRTATNAQDAWVFYPATTDDLFVSSAGNDLFVSAGASANTMMCYGHLGATASNTISVDSEYNCDAGLAIGSQGTGEAARIAMSTPGGAIQQADSDGSDSSVAVPRKEMSTKFVGAFAAEYIAVVSPTPNTCTVQSSSAEVATLSSTGDATYGVHKICFGCGAAAQYVSGPFIVNCTRPAWMYYESEATDDERTVFGTVQNKQGAKNVVTSSDLGSEVNLGSIILNNGQQASAYLFMEVQKNVSDVWTSVETIYGPTLQTINTSYYAVADTWNAAPFNTSNYAAGEYRVYIELQHPNGSTLRNSDTTSLIATDAFTILAGDVILNLTSIEMYDIDVASPANRRLYANDLQASGTNTSFTLVNGSEYRLEVTIENNGTADWVVNQSTINYALANWSINVTDEVWLSNASSIILRRNDATQTGASFNGSLLSWSNNVSTTIVYSGSSATFFAIVAVDKVRNQTSIFDVEDIDFAVTDYSFIESIVVDEKTPYLLSGAYNVSSSEVLRGDSLSVYAQWDEELANANVTYTTTNEIIYATQTNSTPANEFDWTNFTLATQSTWFLGVHEAKIRVADASNNVNDTLESLNFTLYGQASISASSLNTSSIVQGNGVNISCRVIDITKNNQAIQNYVVTFSNATNSLGIAQTDASGWASIVYIDNSLGNENMTCTITNNETTFYQTGTNSSVLALTTIEQQAPDYNEIISPTSANKGSTITLAVNWSDNYALDTATLEINISGNVSTLPLSGMQSWANFTYTPLTTITPQNITWRQFANDTFSNINATPLQTMMVYGWSTIADNSLSPSSMQTTNLTTVACQVVDANQTATKLSNYPVNFYYKNTTNTSYSSIGSNTTNSTGWAVYSFQVNAAGQYDVLCNISDANNYNYTIPFSATESLNVVDGTDYVPPQIVGENYSINDTDLMRYDCISISGLWDESINQSSVRYNYSASPITQLNITSPYNNNWTNVSICTNDSWVPGNYTIQLFAEDQEGNANTSLSELSFRLRARSNLSYVSPIGNLARSTQTFECAVNDVDSGVGIENYPVTFYDSDLGFSIGANVTNASGVTSITRDYAAHPPGPDTITCTYASESSLFYVAQSPTSVQETVYFYGNLSINITQPLVDAQVFRGEYIELNATVLDEDGSTPLDGVGAPATLDARWYDYASVNIANMTDTNWSVPTMHALGLQNITATVNASYYYGTTQVRNISVWSYANISLSEPIATIYPGGQEVQVVCQVGDGISGEVLTNYLVNITQEGSVVASQSTNASGQVSYAFNTSLLGHGVHNLGCRIGDNASMFYLASTAKQTVELTVDTNAPLIDYASNTDTSGNYARDWIVVNVSVNDTNLDEVVLYWNGTPQNFSSNTSTHYYSNISSLDEGDYTFYAYANDTLGLSNQTLLRSVTIDLFDPVVVIHTPVNGTYTNASSVDVTYTATDFTRDSCWYSLNGGVNTSLVSCANITVASLVLGLNNITVYVNDSVNHIGSDVVQVIRDVVLPSITMQSPTNGTIYSQVNVDLNYSVSDNYVVDSCWYNLNSGSNITVASCSNTSIVGLSNDNYTLTLFTNDTAGNMNSSQVEFTINFSELVTTRIAPLDSAVVTTTIVALNASTNKAATSCNYSLDAGALTSLTSGDNMSWSTTVGPLAQGVHNVSYVCTNGVNTSATSTTLFTVDSLPPLVTFVEPTPLDAAIVNNDSVFINITLSEISDAVYLTWMNASGSYNLSLQNSSETNWYRNLTDLEDYNYEYVIFANDTYGNANASTSRSVLVSTGIPVVFIEHPLNNTYNSNLLDLNVSASKTITSWVVNLNGENFTFSPNTTLPTLFGSNTLTVYAKDTLGQLGEASASFTVNSTSWSDTFMTYAGQSASSFVAVDPNSSTLFCWPTVFATSTPQNNPATCWPYRRSLDLSTSSSYSDQQFNLLLNLSGLVGSGSLQSDCADIRFGSANATGEIDQEVPYWIEDCTDTSNVSVWLKFSHLNASSAVYLYHGNSFAEDGSNGTAVFEVFDDFESSPSAATWGSNVANWDVANGEGFSIVAGASSALTSTTTFTDEYVTEIQVRANSSAGAAGYYKLGNPAGSKYIELYLDPANNRIDLFNGIHNYYTVNSSITQKYVLVSDFTTNNYSLYVGENTSSAIALTSATSGSQTTPRLYSYYDRGLFIDKFMMYKYVAAPPVVQSLGAIEYPVVNATMQSELLALPTIDAWDVLTVTSNRPVGTNVSFEIYDVNNLSLCGTISATVATSGYAICEAARYDAVALVANFQTNITNVSASISNWTINTTNAAPRITLYTPLNATTDLDGNVSINFSAFDVSGIASCSVYVNGVLNQTNTSTITNDQAYVFAVNPVTSTSTWFVNCTDADALSRSSETRTIYVDQTIPSVDLTAPLADSGDNDGVVTFSFTPSDPVGISSCDLYLDGVLNQTKSSITLDVVNTFDAVTFDVGTYNWSVSCTDSTGALHQNTSRTRDVAIILTTEFDFATNLSEVNVSNMTSFFVANNGSAFINFTGPLNFSDGADINAVVEIIDGEVQVDSKTLPVLNVSSELTIENLSYVFNPLIFRNGQYCADCVVSNYVGGVVSFSVTHFSNYTTSSNSALEIYDETDVEAGSQIRIFNQQTTFFTNYTNVTSNETITGASCTIAFNETGSWSSPASMTYNATSTLYEYNRSFNATNIYYWRTQCDGSASGFEAINATDTVNISASFAELHVLTFALDEETLIEGKNRTVSINISNSGLQDALNFTVDLNVSKIINFTELQLSLQEGPFNLSTNSSRLVNFTWPMNTGYYEFNISIDTSNVVLETNETNNTFVTYRQVGAWQIYNGNNSFRITLNNFLNEPLQNWSENGVEGILYYADTDSSYYPFNLLPLNATDNDFEEADIALNLSYYVDSLQATFDADDNNISDMLVTKTISGIDVANIPVVNSTNSSSFLTGILYDSADGVGYDGSQDLVFVTWVNSSSSGQYGVYDYEIRVPSALEKLFGASNSLSQLFEQD